jgi:TATA-box binding protein (TBP) (component of TFIID and TFIIIB)
MIISAVMGKKKATTTTNDDDSSFKVQNIVASGTLGQPLHLPGISLSPPCNCFPEIYEQLRTELRPWLKSMSFNQELFPGMCIRMRGEHNAVCLLFASGKCVITGAHQEEEIQQIFHKVYHTIIKQ